MPQQRNGSWSNALLLWGLATVALSPLCASSPHPGATKASPKVEANSKPVVQSPVTFHGFSSTFADQLAVGTNV